MNTVEQQIATAPLPDERELRRRRNVFIQFFRFIALNWKMFWLAKRHH